MSSTSPQRPERVAVVIVTFNSADVISDCLASLPRGFIGVPQFRVIVADNASSDRTLELVRAAQVPVEVVQTGRNAGYSAAINAGVSRLGADEWLLVLNPDVRLGEGCVAALLDAAVRSGSGLVGPSLWNTLPDGSRTRQWSQRRDPALRHAFAEGVLGGGLSGRLGLGEVVTSTAAYDRDTDVDWLTGAAVLISPQCRAAVGTWDESFFLYSEETDYCQRVRAAGFAVSYVHDATAWHLGGELHTSPALASLLVVNKVRLFARAHSAVAVVLFRLALVLGQAIRAARGNPVSRAALRALVTGRPMPISGAPDLPTI